MTADEHLGYVEQRAELTAATKRADTAETDLTKEKRRTADLRAWLSVDDDRRDRSLRTQLDAVLVELVRRGVATDLVPGWWRDNWNAGPRDEATMRAGWPDHLGLAQHCRDLVDALHAADREVERQVRMRRAADESRDSWREEALARGFTYPAGPDWDDPDVREQYNAELAEKEAGRREKDREEARQADVRARAGALAGFVRTLKRLPVSPKKLPYGVLDAVADAVAPRNGQPVALPADVVSEICRLAAERQTADLVRQYEINGAVLDAPKVLARVLATYDAPAGAEVPTPAPDPDVPTLFDQIPGGGA